VRFISPPARLDDLRSFGVRIDAKIRAEDEVGPKKSSGVDVHQGGEGQSTSLICLCLNLFNSPYAATYRFGYYLEKADFHHILIKVNLILPCF
jgi:hypothetical protein